MIIEKSEYGQTIIPFHYTNNGLISAKLVKIRKERNDAHMFDSDHLMRCRAADFNSCDTVSLVDLRDIRIDAAKPVPERVLDFMAQVKNPYLFKVGDITVKVNYGDGKPITDALAKLFRAG